MARKPDRGRAWPQRRPRAAAHVAPGVYSCGSAFWGVWGPWDGAGATTLTETETGRQPREQSRTQSWTGTSPHEPTAGSVLRCPWALCSRPQGRGLPGCRTSSELPSSQRPCPSWGHPSSRATSLWDGLLPASPLPSYWGLEAAVPPSPGAARPGAACGVCFTPTLTSPACSPKEMKLPTPPPNRTPQPHKQGFPRPPAISHCNFKFSPQGGFQTAAVQALETWICPGSQGGVTLGVFLSLLRRLPQLQPRTVVGTGVRPRASSRPWAGPAGSRAARLGAPAWAVPPLPHAARTGEGSAPPICTGQGRNILAFASRRVSA